MDPVPSPSTPALKRAQELQERLLRAVQAAGFEEVYQTDVAVHTRVQLLSRFIAVADVSMAYVGVSMYERDKVIDDLIQREMRAAADDKSQEALAALTDSRKAVAQFRQWLDREWPETRRAPGR